MKLRPEQIAAVRKSGIYATEACDDCHKILNQAHRFTIAKRPEVYCSAEERDRAMGIQPRIPRTERAKKVVICAYCGGDLEVTRSDSLYCSNRCKIAQARISRRKSKSAK